MAAGDENKKNQNLTDDQDKNIKWDKGEVTYGHSAIQPTFKRKDEPDDGHLEENESTEALAVSKKLKNMAFDQNADVGNREADEEKGIGGKRL